jgi:hypothetical protein
LLLKKKKYEFDTIEQAMSVFETAIKLMYPKMIECTCVKFKSPTRSLAGYVDCIILDDKFKNKETYYIYKKIDLNMSYEEAINFCRETEE